jgi:TorA maturation chaperone TorD
LPGTQAVIGHYFHKNAGMGIAFMNNDGDKGQSMTTQTSAAIDQSASQAQPYWDGPATDELQQYRSGAWRLLASLLRETPDEAMLAHVQSLSEIESDNDELSVALQMLGLATRHCDVDTIDDEFHALFIGLGRGELVPYGSWYMTGFLMEKPLGTLRDDLARLGYERNEETREPEDHFAALAEVMSLMIDEGATGATGDELELQQRFFDAHIGGWAEKFFEDMTNASSAVFYRSVGRLGTAFIRFEKQFLSMKV